MLNKKRRDWRARATEADLKEAVRNSLQELYQLMIEAVRPLGA